MSLTRSESRLHAIYEALPEAYRTVIDEAWNAASAALRSGPVYSGPKLDTYVTLNVAGDDRAECLVGAITRLVIESNPDDAAIKAAIAEVDAP